MIGETVSHYRILEELGGGAMGIVYKAQDTRLKRLVALKFLPPGMTRDHDAKQRFVQEAEAASALDNPHVCTIHDIDETADGRVFIAMGFYDGETLKKRIQQGPLSLDESIGYARQIALGLAAAHEAGIIHRDIKPANVMITKRSEAKIVDFGIAKLAGQGDLTGTGLSLGTVAYMAPEQFQGPVDDRADLWSLGVVLYEMLAGQRPFDGDNDATRMNAVLHQTPQPLKALRREVPDGLAAIVEQALQKDPSRRFASASDFARALDALQFPAISGAAPRSDARAVFGVIRRPVIALPLLAIIGGLGYLLATTLIGQSRARWAREEAVPQIQQLLQRDEYAPAFALAQQAIRYIPSDPTMAELMPEIAQQPSFTTRPEGARVSVKPYTSPDSDWQLLGTTPLKDVLLPRGAYRWRIQSDGFDPVEFARNVGDLVVPQTIELAPAGTRTAGMVSVPAGQAPVRLSGFATEERLALDAFQIDRTEVTNRRYKEFVDAGGYARRDYWKHEIVQDGRVIPWEDAMALFKDSSGRPGPATWELGNYRDGQGDFPVTGVSWYEAAAYAEFRGASLPTIYHWARAALELTNAAPLRGRIVEASNFSGKAPAPVASTNAMGPYGTYDMAGNVREWCANQSGSNRWTLGGSWNDHVYMFMVPYSLPPTDRSNTNGFRLVKYSEKEPPARLSSAIEVFRRDFRTAKPVSDEVFAVFKRQFEYTPSPANAKLGATDMASPDWTRETVSIDTGYGERMSVLLYLPKQKTGRRQAVVFFPGLTQFATRSSIEKAAFVDPVDFIIKSGRILVLPAYKGSYERFDGFLTLTGDRYGQVFRQRMREWRQETGQLLDYLATRPDVDPNGLAYSGLSFGASVALPVLAIEPRFKAAVLLLAGLSYRDVPPEVDALNFVPRIKIPVLMLEGRYDHLFPVETSQQPLLGLLGTPAEQKRQVAFDAGHGPLPRGQVIQEALGWLDRYVGPVQ